MMGTHSLDMGIHVGNQSDMDIDRFVHDNQLGIDRYMKSDPGRN